jgi:hypothetical protein
MWKTVSAAEGMTASEVVLTIVSANTAALVARKSPLRNIIINCHGKPGKLSIGGSGKPGIEKSNVALFGVLKPSTWARSGLSRAGLRSGQTAKAYVNPLPLSLGHRSLRRRTTSQWALGAPIAIMPV